jgi:putative ATP-dependent endonuclease of OLD family
MHISQLTLVNYRNFPGAKLTFTKGVNTIIGENGSGKTNLFRALRLLLDDSMSRSAFRLDESDFHRGLGNWRGHWIVISIEFDEISADEAVQALFLHGTGVLPTVARATYNLIFRPKKDVRLRLAALDDFDNAALDSLRNDIQITDYETVITGRSTADFSDPAVYRQIVGDFDLCVFRDEVDDPRVGSRLPNFLSIANEVSFTYVQALRDVVAEFHNNRTNPLLALLKSKSGEISAATMAPIVAQVQQLNESIVALSDVQDVRSDIRGTIKAAAGETYSPHSLSIRSDLPEEADKLFQSLKLFVGESADAYEGAIHELSLGGANLIFLTLKLLEFQYQRANQSIANFLVVEEPEAHIHTHIQKTLFDRISYEDTQIIYSTHSPQISEVSNVRSINVLGRRGTACEAYQPATGLDDETVGTVQRYLDAVRSNLLFAKSVVLVEGDAEEILVPLLFKKVFGLSLDELGVSLVNVRSTGFQNVAVLFHDSRIRKRCAIITDRDAAILDTNPVPGEPARLAAFRAKCAASDAKGAARQIALNTFVGGNPWLTAKYAAHTFEVDFVEAGNEAPVEALVTQIYVDPPTIAAARADISSGDKARYGRRVLTMAANQGKGWFAIMLGAKIDHKTILPAYIAEAIFFARPELSKELFSSIFNYRLTKAREAGSITQAALDAARIDMRLYLDEAASLADLKTAMLAALPGDQVHRHLANVT